VKSAAVRPWMGQWSLSETTTSTTTAVVLTWRVAGSVPLREPAAAFLAADWDEAETNARHDRSAQQTYLMS
jgi:hypothetical protein